jgi:hypothetical protein
MQVVIPAMTEAGDMVRRRRNRHTRAHPHTCVLTGAAQVEIQPTRTEDTVSARLAAHSLNDLVVLKNKMPQWNDGARARALPPPVVTSPAQSRTRSC